MFTQENIDWQIWIDEGDRPMPRKVLIVRHQDEDMPRRGAHIQSWDAAVADEAERRIREALGREGFHWELKCLSDRPALREKKANLKLARTLEAMAVQWDVPLKHESSVWPSVAGLVVPPTAVVCGLGPVATDLYRPQEAIQRISLLQRTLLLSQFLLEEGRPGGKA